ncbi:MFS transporter superfamily protein, partial [Pleurotus pulmonarius]
MANSKDQFSSSTDSEKNDGVSITSVPRANDTHSQAFERRTMRLVDFRVLPLLAVVYAIALIDRINLGVARTAGMGADLNLTVGSRFSIVTCLYFIPYILGQLPGNLVLRLLGARNWLAFCVVAWGAVQLGMGFVPTWGWLILCRVLLGLFEAPFFPALVYIISTWYKRYEVQKRLAAFYLSSITISGFSPIIAYGLSLLDGKKGIAGWEWIFVSSTFLLSAAHDAHPLPFCTQIIEGAITIALGLILFYALPDFPDKNTFLTPEQTAFVLKRVEDDRGDSV